MIPEGMRDVLPPEAGELRAIAQIVLARFGAYGYGEVRPPALEYPETMERTGVPLLTSGFHLYDERGRALVLRTDLTTSVCRLAADRLRDHALPLRLAYEGPIYRTEASRHRREGEFVQLGAELLGLGSAAADAEAVVLLCDALAATGLRGFRLAIGSVAFHRELVAALGLPPDDSDDIFDALADRDYALLESIVSRHGIGDDGARALQRALDLSPGKGALAAARKLASSEAMEEVVERLVAVQDLADDAGYGDLVGFDFGLMPELDYYTGIVIEAYAPGVDFPVANGGRYDRLLCRLRLAHPGRRLHDRPRPAPRGARRRRRRRGLGRPAGAVLLRWPRRSAAGHRAAPPGRRRRRPAGRRRRAAAAPARGRRRVPARDGRRHDARLVARGTAGPGGRVSRPADP